MKAHLANGGEVWNPGIQGFAVNRKGKGYSCIFVKNNHLDALMLVLGHEIGHVITPRLPDLKDEEAKAFAFEMSWAKAIIEHNIAGLKGQFNVDFKPAANGIHNIAFGFVQSMINKGKDSLKLYWELVKGSVRVEKAQN